MPEYGFFGDFYDETSLVLKSHTGKRAVYEDVSGAQIVLQGNGLAFAGDNITKGKVTGVLFLDGSGGTLISVSDGTFDARKLSQAFIKNDDIWEFMTQLTAGNDKIYGSNVGNDFGFGENHGNDLIVAGKAGSYMAGSEGNDTMRGGAGWDTISFAGTFWSADDKHGITLDATKGTISDSWGDKDKFDTRFEEFDGSVYRDVMKGSSRDEAFAGMKGADVIDGGGGWDELRYHRDERFNGDDGIVASLANGTILDGFGTIDKVKNIEAVYGTYFDDRFTGDSRDNQFRGISGVDSFDGGKGKDEVNFDWWEDLGQHGVEVDLSLTSNQIKDDGFGNTETTKSIEALGGGDFDDKLTLGSSGGWANGKGGNDILTAGAAGDSLEGGDGDDTFVFLTSLSIGTRSGTHSVIDDFEQGNDQIDLSAINGLSFIGTNAFSNVAGELRYLQAGNNTFLLGDANGDGTADFALELKGTVDLVGGDLLL
ncbi:hypothetical protein JJB09_22520 [Rhizobium sp. KVB221]|uniref:Calcium-binding protein n=1 Tax=Rhizobium setariae TaxID=2801340 RepID=A0A936YTR6_9HYPH|nr:hypothetical protein [Rhizobium setariae]MBL0374792.1 hypothetical protein [Rhizobium setariae]